MWPSSKPSTLILSIVFAWFLGVCYGFVLISSATPQTGETNLFDVGESLVYQLHSTVLLNEKSDGAKSVGFYIAGDVIVDTVWRSGNERVLRFELRSPQLHIKSRKAPSPDGFIQHSSKLEDFYSKPFLVAWSSGKIDQILIAKKEPIALKNLKKGIASLFQFQLLDLESNETDSSGHCTVHYQNVAPVKFQKIKTNCQSPEFPYLKNRDAILDTIVRSSRVTNYELDSSHSYIKTIASRERHQMYLAVKEDLGNYLEADQILTHVRTGKVDQIKANSLEDALKSAQNYVEYHQETLLTDKEEIAGEESSFINTINDVRENLKPKHLGAVASAKSFIRLVKAARKADMEDIAKALSIKKNQRFLSPLLDALGHAASKEVHETVMENLFFESAEYLDASERYLWALATSSHPNAEIVESLLHHHMKSSQFPEKVRESLVLTMATMAGRLAKTPSTPNGQKIRRSVEDSIVNDLGFAKGVKRYAFLRALRNLKSPSTIPVLLKTIKNGTSKEGVLAFKALKSIGSSDENVLKVARRAFLQLDKKHDSSSRTIAADILLESNPSDEILTDFLHYLASNDSCYEVKQYVLQRIRMIADENQEFRLRVEALIKSSPSLNNYSVLSPRGMSTALKRNFLHSESSNGSLSTIQEIFGGIVKRGVVNVVIDKNNYHKEIINLGIFAGGLSSLMSSDSEGDEETATAGMELTVLDTQIRPFVFFTGQGELMGHVWSGTASERTTAFQAMILLQDHLEYLRLGSGFIAKLDLKGAMSFDLSGKIEVSIWSRTADSLVEKSAGLVANGLIVVDSAFVRSQVEFSASVEPKLSLKSDIDFSSNMNLCMKVTQPETIFRHNVFKIERIPGSKHKLRIAKYKKQLIPGTTYSLNRKNNEMCSAMFK